MEIVKSLVVLNEFENPLKSLSEFQTRLDESQQVWN